MMNPPVQEVETLFDPVFLDRVRALFLQLRKRRLLRKRGAQSTPATGHTRDFKDYRHYTAGEDYRAIDWRLYARLERLFVRLFEEIQELHVHVIVDTSESMRTPHGEKRLTALRLAAALGYLGLVGQHRVSVHSMGAGLRNELPPLRGVGNMRRIANALSKMEYGGITDLAGSFRGFHPGKQRAGVIFVISDLLGGSLDAAASALPRAALWPGETHLLHLCHPDERTPAWSGELELRDAESGETRRILFSARERERYRQAFDVFCEDLRRQCAARQIDYLQWITDQPFETMFLQLLRRGSALAG